MQHILEIPGIDINKVSLIIFDQDRLVIKCKLTPEQADQLRAFLGDDLNADTVFPEALKGKSQAMELVSPGSFRLNDDQLAVAAVCTMFRQRTYNSTVPEECHLSIDCDQKAAEQIQGISRICGWSKTLTKDIFDAFGLDKKILYSYSDLVNAIPGF